tara:strand:- start:2901 stop:3311 length:411 start_codon:yes stop_codon:yes gene_type:complete
MAQPRTGVCANVAREIAMNRIVLQGKIRARQHVARVSSGVIRLNANRVVSMVTTVLPGLLCRKPPLPVQLGNGPMWLALQVHLIVQSVPRGDSHRRLPKRRMTSAPNVTQADIPVRLAKHRMTGAKVDVQLVNGPP